MQTGKIKYVFKYYPILDQGNDGESHWAAQAAECANEQGRFWDFHDKLFLKWLGENVGMYQKSQLKKFAGELKLDTAKFNACLDSGKAASVVAADVVDGAKLQVRGTPTFFINDKPLQLRSLDYEEFARAIDSYLK